MTSRKREKNADGEPRRRSPSDRTVKIPTTAVTEPGDGPDVQRTPEADLSSQYEILEKIGDGGMGVVWLARDRRLGRYAAIKRLNRTGISRKALRQRFFREAKAVAALNHIYIVHVYVLGEDSEGPYIIMEYIPGPPEASPGKVPPSPFTLMDRINRDGPLPVNDALDLMLKLCRAVEYAHACGVIHRDLKPSNVLFDESGEPKIVDFGLARQLGVPDDRLTVTGEKMLSLGYGAPEQETDASLTDERSDVYGLGALFFFSVTGRNPRYFRREDIPETLAAPISRALEPDPVKRWQGVRQLSEALNEIKAPSSVELPTVKTTWHCKWCDTVNPVAIRYCGKCGWDGGETCMECGAETRFGVQFCGACGADAREYEAASNLLARLRARWEEKDYEFIVRHAGKIDGFHPVGEKGRSMGASVRELAGSASSALKRKNEMAEEIPRQMTAGNYERVRRCLEQYRKLSNDGRFEDIAGKLPRHIRTRDITEADKAMKNGEWRYAERICKALAEKNGERDSEALALLGRIKRLRWRRRGGNAIFIALGLLILYVLSDAPLQRLFGSSETGACNSVYRPVTALYRHTPLRAGLEKYASLWGVGDMYSRRLPPPAPPDTAVKPPVSSKLKSLRKEYDQSLEKIEADHTRRMESWPADYIEDLKSAQRRLQEAGDLVGWLAVTEELRRFRTDGELLEEAPEDWPAEARGLHSKYESLGRKHTVRLYNQVIRGAERYVKRLTELRKKLTKAGRMTEALTVNDEIEDVESGARLTEAREKLEALKSENEKKPSGAS
ncbi:MAG: serine/threonine-protein kinase [Kiritimatiellia bacterium]